MANDIEIKDGTITTERGTVYFTRSEEALVKAILAGGGRLISLEHLIGVLYEQRDEPEWPEETVLMLLSNARKKLARVGLKVVNVARRGYRIDRHDA